MTLPLVPTNQTPSCPFPEITLPLPAADAADDIGTALNPDTGKDVGQGFCPGDIRADVIPT